MGSSDGRQRSVRDTWHRAAAAGAAHGDARLEHRQCLDARLQGEGRRFPRGAGRRRAGGNVDRSIDSNTLYRRPLQPSLDGNTVELTTEQTAFAENAVAYQTTLAFLNGRISTITRALKGE
ncbi:flagellar basal body rod protein FlgB [Sphingomonas panni]